jgi:hypothetical protein
MMMTCMIYFFIFLFFFYRECNYVIDKNLITGFTLVDLGGKRAPIIKKDQFWDDHHIAPLYSLDAAKRTVHPLIGSASKVNLVKNLIQVTMAPHKMKIAKLSEEEQAIIFLKLISSILICKKLLKKIKLILNFTLFF